MTSNAGTVSKQADTPARDGPSPPSGPSNGQLLRWMFQFLLPVKGLALLAGAVLLGFIGIEVLTARQVGQAVTTISNLDATAREIDRVGGFWSWIISSEAIATSLRSVMLLLVAMVIMLGVLRYLRETSQVRLAMTMLYNLREAVYDKLQHVGFRFHDRISTGQLINRALTDLQHVRQFLQTAVLTSLEIGLTVTGYVILLMTKNAWVALLAVAPVPIWAWYILRFGKKVQPVTRSVMEAEDRNVSLITENIAGVHVVKAFATEPVEIHKYNRNCDLFMGRVLKRVRLFANFTPIIRGIATASHLTLFLAAGILIIRGKLDVGDFLVLGAAMGSILGKLQQVAAINEQYQAAIVSARRLHEVLAAPQTIPERPGAVPLPPDGGGSVRFENVSFGYDPDRPVLHDISFDLPAGSTVAIVGPTGAGKSTLVSLIGRFYDPQKGRILIDGVDLRDLRLSSLRPQVAYVFQETYLFSDTVAANISYGRPHIRGGEVEAAARLAQAHEFITELPRGYDTMLGERGASLSGGQRQRLAIARAILQNPRILVLDDATAAVDPETDDLIRRGMRFVMKGRTTFLIAHRISSVKQADLVIVLENGRITQMGKHDDLMAEGGHYAHIASAQLHGAKVPGEPPSHMDRMGQPHGVPPQREAMPPEGEV